MSEVETGKATVALPRPYQREAIEVILNARERGRQRVLITLPPGCGKTNIFCWAMQAMRRQRPALILAHRDELVRQVVTRIEALAPGMNVKVEKATETAGPEAEVVVASVQTLGRQGSNRLEWLAALGPELIICDEAHHAPADSYQRIFHRFGAFEPGGAFLVGVTATPSRLDARAMGRVFEAEVFRYELRAALAEGWLCPIRAYRVVTDTDLAGVRVQQGDFEVGGLSRAVNTKARTRTIIEHWQQVAAGRRTLAFCVDVQHAHDTAALFQSAGIPAEAIDGTLPLTERRAILARLKSGATLIVANCAVLTEGFDCPEVAGVVLLRPTKSAALYTQMAGRGMRTAPGKADLVLIDVVDNVTRHSLITAPVMLGLPPNIDLEGESLAEAARLVEALGAGAGVLDVPHPVTVRQIETRLKEWDLFGAIELPAPMVAVTTLAWTPLGAGFFLACGPGREARIQVDMVGAYHLDLKNHDGRTHHQALGADLAPAMAKAERFILRCWPAAGGLIKNDQRWRGDKASAAQLRLLRRRGLPEHVLAKLSKGDAARSITQMLQK